MCDTYTLPIAPLRAPNRQPPLRLQSQRAARDGDKPTVDRNRHNATGCNRAQRKLVRARAGGNGVPFPFPGHGLHPGRSGMHRALGVCLLLAVMPIDRTEPGYPTRLTSPNAADIVISTGRYSNIESTPQGRQASETAQLLPRNPV